MKINRPNWDEYFIEIMHTVGKRSTCDRGQVGCVITRDNRILSTGYAGSAAGTAHCDDVGHEMHTITHNNGQVSEHCIRTAHAEQNALVTAARHGVSTDGATVYCKMTPCYICAKLIINAGIKRVIAWRDYHASARTKEVFAEAGIKMDIINSETEQYADKD